MATNKPPKSGQDSAVTKKPADILQKQPVKVTDAADSTGHVTSLQNRSANPANDPKTKVYKARGSSNSPDTPQLQRPELLSSFFSQSDFQQLEVAFCVNQQPDINMLEKLSVKLNIPKQTIAKWFEKKRSEAREIEYYREIMKYFQLQAMQQQQEYNARQGTSQSAALSQASSSMNYPGQPTGRYLTIEDLSYLDYLFTSGLRCPNANCLFQLAIKLNVSQQHLALWFEKRFDAWKKEQAKLEQNIQTIQRKKFEEQQKQQQSSTGDSQVPLCSEAPNVPLKKHQSDYGK